MSEENKHDTAAPPPYDDAYAVEPSSQSASETDLPHAEPLDDAAAKQLLLNEVDKNCCWGSWAAKASEINEITSHSPSRACVWTFVEGRKVVERSAPYAGGPVDLRSNPLVDPWSIVVARPVAFHPSVMEVILPQSDVVVMCGRCAGAGRVTCHTCNGSREERCWDCRDVHGHKTCHRCQGFKHVNCGQCQGRVRHDPNARGPRQKIQCHNCHGRGRMGCEVCRENGWLQCRTCVSHPGWTPCRTCHSSGIVNCSKCAGFGRLKDFLVVVITWRNFENRQIIESTNSDEQVHADCPVSKDQLAHASGVLQFLAEGGKVDVRMDPTFTAAPDNIKGTLEAILTTQTETAIAENQMILKQRCIVEGVPLQRVSWLYKDEPYVFWVYGTENTTVVLTYPYTCCWCCSIM
eukprot:TRINITY_DN2717_c0_g1_i4.p1 TRINITY_DN2717_c0_g1~~TRINITY_DN2717_c0_g1_i4.p1  ORF type:complete len:406 (+),score=62.77 TRINITY_DN2717_c0_g1_i4:135-1352(+)